MNLWPILQRYAASIEGVDKVERRLRKSAAALFLSGRIGEIQPRP